MLSGNTLSCGCIRSEKSAARAATRNLSHGMTKTLAFGVWSSMISRCTNPRAQAWANYGGRGITVCQRWLDSFPNFHADMGPRPTARHTLDRINNDLGYSPDNCRWETRRVQQNNRRVTRMVEFNGVTKSISDWADHLGIAYGTLLKRFDKSGWSAERALTTPAASVARRASRVRPR